MPKYNVYYTIETRHEVHEVEAASPREAAELIESRSIDELQDDSDHSVTTTHGFVAMGAE